MFPVTFDLITLLNLAMLITLTALVVYVVRFITRIHKALRRYRALVSQYQIALKDEMATTECQYYTIEVLKERINLQVSVEADLRAELEAYAKQTK